MPGDIRQLGPFSITKDPDKVNASAQIRISLIKQIAFVGIPMCQLYINTHTDTHTRDGQISSSTP